MPIANPDLTSGTGYSFQVGASIEVTPSLDISIGPPSDSAAHARAPGSSLNGFLQSYAPRLPSKRYTQGVSQSGKLKRNCRDPQYSQVVST
jgi:hypothetical protein